MTFANVPPVASASHVPVSGQPVDAEGLVARLEGLVGRAHVLTGEGATRGFSHGIRFGAGPVLAVVQPGSLVEQWRVLCACVAAGVIVITQAANTGLTGGSTPDGTYDRPVVIISTRRLHGIHLIDQGRQVVCLPGATLYELEALLRPLGREPHSVIGSSCIGASVMGGICNNSGGALVRRGPAYSEMALYARVDARGQLELVNHLGIALGEEAEAMLARLERGGFTPEEIDLAPRARPVTMAMPGMSARSMPIRPPVSTPIRAVCSRRRAARAKSCCSPSASIRLKRTRKPAFSTSAPTIRRN
jgi:D-lactate dehydrogenase